MKRFIIFFFFIFISFIFVSNSSTTNPIISIENLQINGIGNVGSTNITLSKAPNGLSGYNITISLGNSSIAEIESIEFPEWATLHANSSLPSSLIWIKAVDLNKKIEGNATNVTLATIYLKSKQEGTIFMNISMTKMDDDNGYPIDIITKNATLNVFVNHPPNKPSSTNPSNGVTNAAITTTLSWQCSDIDGDSLTYDVYFGTSTNPPKVAGNITSKSYNPGTLQYSTKYYWRIVAWDEHGAKNSSQIWHFTTEAYTLPPNQPPTITVTSPSNNATVNGTITIRGNASDDKDVVKVEIMFDNGSWVQAQGTTSWVYNLNTMSLKNGWHTIKARAWDGSLYSDIKSIYINIFNNHGRYRFTIF